MGATDFLNCILNYGYSLIESQCFRAINAAGLDTHVGFMHEINAGKTPLVYDLQEPFRCLVDVAVINCLEKRVFTRDDFIRTENYNLRLKPNGAKKLIAEFEAVFNDRVPYRDGQRTWAYIIMLKAQELGLFLLGKRHEIDFSTPELTLKRTDDYELRQKILSIPYAKAKSLGLSKGTLWPMKRKALSNKPFRIYQSVREKIINYPSA
jgi:CRISPR-associated protein Cas1